METPAKYQVPEPPGWPSLDESVSPFPIRTVLLGALQAYIGAAGAGGRPETWVETTLTDELCERIAHARLTVERLAGKEASAHESGCTCVGCAYLRVAQLYATLPEPYQRLVQTCQEEAERRLERTLTPEEAADVLRVNPQTVYRNLRAGKLPGGKVGTNWRIARSDLEEYLRFGGLPARTQVKNEWMVWSWVPATPDSPAFWYEECSCRNQVDAENIVKLFQRVQPSVPVRASRSKPEEIPKDAAANGEGEVSC